MRYLLAALIRLYQRFSRLTPAVCRFYPTCSCYAQTAIMRFGVLRGGFLAALAAGKAQCPADPQNALELHR